jgi:hypothetical protein
MHFSFIAESHFFGIFLAEARRARGALGGLRPPPRSQGGPAAPPDALLTPAMGCTPPLPKAPPPNIRFCLVAKHPYLAAPAGDVARAEREAMIN